MDNFKADKEIAHENIAALNVLFKQLEQAVILIVENLKNVIPTPDKTENSIIQKYNFLLKQATTLLKWINSKTQGENEESKGFEPPKLSKFICASYLI